MCPSARSATTVPSIESHRNRKFAEFVGPEERTVEDVAGHHAGEQDEGLGDDDRRADTFGDQADAAVQQEGGVAQA